jgi:hypothetical protein
MRSRAPSPRIGATGFLAVALAGASCTGTINGDGRGAGGSPTTHGGSTGAGGGTGGTGVDHPPPPASLCQSIDPGPSPLRLLTRVEYVNTVRDLFGGMANVTIGDLPEDGRPARGYANDTTARSASDLLVDKFFQSADKLATQALGQMSALLGGCDPVKSGDGACIGQFLDNFGKRAWRRPLTAVEKHKIK